MTRVASRNAIRGVVVLFAVALAGLWFAHTMLHMLPAWPPAFVLLFAVQERIPFALTVAVTGGFGIEYMFWDRFSIGGQTGLPIASDRRERRIARQQLRQ